MSGPLHARRLIIVVTAAERDDATADILAAVPDAGPNVFSAGLVPAGSEPGTLPTHYWCSWQVTATQIAALQGRLRGQVGRFMFLGVARDAPATVDGETELAPEQVLERLSLARTTPSR